MAGLLKTLGWIVVVGGATAGGLIATGRMDLPKDWADRLAVFRGASPDAATSPQDAGNGGQAKVQGAGKGGGKGGRGGPDATPVKVGTVQIADVPLYLEGVGTARARNQVTVRSQADGKLLKINFKEGETVKRGDVLAKIDPVTYKAQLDVTSAKKALDEALIANTRRDLERYLKVGTLAVTQQQIDTQKALVLQQEAQIRSDQANVENLTAILGYTDIVAPIDGRTGLRLVDEGNLVRAGDATGIVVITEMQPIAVQFNLPQQQLGQVTQALAKGPVVAEAADTEGRRVLDTGRLLVVDNQVDPTTGTVRYKAEFANAGMQLWPGQFVNVKLLVDTLKQVVVVPTVALQRGPNGTYVFVAGDDGKVSQRTVQIAQQTEAGSVVTSGVTAGERVVISGFTRLQDGARINVVGDRDKDGAAVSGNGAVPPPNAAPANTTGPPPGANVAPVTTSAPGALGASGAPGAPGANAQPAPDDAKPGRGEHRRKRDASAAR